MRNKDIILNSRVYRVKTVVNYQLGRICGLMTIILRTLITTDASNRSKINKS